MDLGIPDALWTSLLFLPLGFWAVRRWEAAAGLALAVGGMIATPALTPLLWPGLAEAVGAIGGLAAGRALGHVTRRRS